MRVAVGVADAVFRKQNGRLGCEGASVAASGVTRSHMAVI
jgi:hypothetical protein